MLDIRGNLTRLFKEIHYGPFKLEQSISVI